MKNYQEYANRLNELFINSAYSILDIANTFTEAKNNLSKVEFEKFIKLTKYSEKSASVRKWLKIGEAYLRLKSVVDYLPPNWSTIYKLATLRSNEFEALIEANILNRDMTAKEIDAELNLRKKKQVVTIILEFDPAVDADSFKNDYDTVVNSLPVNLCQIKLSQDADALIKKAINVVQPLRKAA